MRVLFIGGTGVISTAVSKLAVKKKIDLWLLNRGNHNNKAPRKAKIITGDINNIEQMKELLQGEMFDVIVQWISFTVDHVKRDYELFKGHTKQYIFISSASAYQKPIPKLPITEDVPLDNPYWQYSKNKQLCEEYLQSVHSDDFNVTIVRPSHTYDDSKIVFQLKSRTHPYTMIHRILHDEKVIMFDQGLTMWTLTYNKDFAYAFLDLLGNPRTYGEAYHLTSEFVYSWERIYEMMCEILKKSPHPAYLPTDHVLKYFPSYEEELIGDKNNSLYFDNTKIRRVAPNYQSKTDYSNILKKALKRYLKDKKLQVIDEEFNRQYDKCITEYVEEKV